MASPVVARSLFRVASCVCRVMGGGDVDGASFGATTTLDSVCLSVLRDQRWPIGLAGALCGAVGVVGLAWLFTSRLVIDVALEQGLLDGAAGVIATAVAVLIAAAFVGVGTLLPVALLTNRLGQRRLELRANRLRVVEGPGLFTRPRGIMEGRVAVLVEEVHLSEVRAAAVDRGMLYLLHRDGRLSRPLDLSLHPDEDLAWLMGELQQRIAASGPSEGSEAAMEQLLTLSASARGSEDYSPVQV